MRRAGAMLDEDAGRSGERGIDDAALHAEMPMYGTSKRGAVSSSTPARSRGPRRSGSSIE